MRWEIGAFGWPSCGDVKMNALVCRWMTVFGGIRWAIFQDEVIDAFIHGFCREIL